jgi:hypothetical protein
MNADYVRICKEEMKEYLKVLSHHLLGETYENHEEPQSEDLET